MLGFWMLGLDFGRMSSFLRTFMSPASMCRKTSSTATLASTIAFMQTYTS